MKKFKKILIVLIIIGLIIFIIGSVIKSRFDAMIDAEMGMRI